MSDKNKILSEFKSKTKSIMGNSLKQIILYGSYARGDFNKSSDVDIMILTDLSLKEIEEYRDKIYFYLDGVLVENTDKLNKFIIDLTNLPFTLKVDRLLK